MFSIYLLLPFLLLWYMLFRFYQYHYYYIVASFSLLLLYLTDVLSTDFVLFGGWPNGQSSWTILQSKVLFLSIKNTLSVQHWPTKKQILRLLSGKHGFWRTNRRGLHLWRIRTLSALGHLWGLPGWRAIFWGMRYFSGACPPMSYQPCGVKMRKVRIDGGYAWISLAMSSFYLGTDTRLCSKFTKWSFPIIPAQGVNVVYV